jgi:hypothetical protein
MLRIGGRNFSLDHHKRLSKNALEEKLVDISTRFLYIWSPILRAL